VASSSNGGTVPTMYISRPFSSRPASFKYQVNVTMTWESLFIARKWVRGKVSFTACCTFSSRQLPPQCRKVQASAALPLARNQSGHAALIPHGEQPSPYATTAQRVNLQLQSRFYLVHLETDRTKWKDRRATNKRPYRFSHRNFPGSRALEGELSSRKLKGCVRCC
jgi:hypothetical protein